MVRRFEGLWLQGQRPHLDDFLPRDESLRQATLLELVHAELELRLKAGEPARVEDYFRRFPDLAELPEVEWDLVQAEYRHRRRREPELSLDEYRQRFPHWEADLARLPSTLPRCSVRGRSQVSPEVPPPLPGYEILEELG